MITSYEATVVTTDDIVHEVNLEGKRIGYVIKTENKETPTLKHFTKVSKKCAWCIPERICPQKKKPNFWQL